MIRRPPRSPLFPSPPLSRSPQVLGGREPQSRAGGASRDLGMLPPLEPESHSYRSDSTGSTAAARRAGRMPARSPRSEEHTSELQSLAYLVCRLLLEKKKNNT